jgi:lysozyme family protein
MTPELIFQQTWKWEYEKGITDNPNDHGGKTNDGITFDHYSRHCQEVLGRPPQYSHFLTMSMTEIFKFYQRIWQRMGCHMIKNSVLAGICFDFGFNSGNAKREIQEVLQKLGYKIAADNVFGPATLAALNHAYSVYGEDLIDLIFIARLNYMSELAYREQSQITFIKGWFNRVADWRIFSKTNRSVA